MPVAVEPCMVDRRRFLAGASGMGMAFALGDAFWRGALAQSAPGGSPYGALLPADGNGLELPAGFTSRIVATSQQPVPGTSYVWHPFPDGGACVPTDGGGWIYVSNSENPPPVDLPLGAVGDALGGASAIRFDSSGAIVDAYRILEGTQSNCAGGLTPWGTWLSCEEIEGGQVWECDPFGEQAAVARPALGRFKHEMAAVDPARGRVYLTEDQPDGLLYRFTGETLEDGVLEAMAVAGDGSVTWLAVPDPAAASVRTSVAGATAFDGGEGVVFDSDKVYVTTKGDDRVWVHDVVADTMRVLYPGGGALNGVDNIVASAAHDLYVAEDGGNLEVCIITPELVVAPVLRMTGPQHGIEQPTPLPLVSEVTGLAFSPDGNRLYFNSERGGVFGILYEVSGPWRGGTLAAQPSGPSAPSGPPGASGLSTPAAPDAAARGTGSLAATGGRSAWPAASAAVAGALAWRAGRRADRTPPP